LSTTLEAVRRECRGRGVEVKRVDPKETNMLALCTRLAAAIHGYLAYYMPTNRAVGWLRSPRGLKWAIPVALVATPGYLFAMSVCMTVIERGGPGYLNMLVMLFGWNAAKFAVLAIISSLLLVRNWVLIHHRSATEAPEAGQQGELVRA